MYFNSNWLLGHHNGDFLKISEAKTLVKVNIIQFGIISSRTAGLLDRQLSLINNGFSVEQLSRNR